MFGNFIADSIKGKQSQQYPESVQLGIRIHQFIDAFTDGHEQVLQSRRRLYPHFGKYAGVVQDIFYDHFLALSWPSYHPMPLDEFAERVYRVIEAQSELLNERSRRTFRHMSTHNWLLNYREEQGIDRALKGMAYRASYPSNMENAIPVLRTHFEELQSDYSSFFPELKRAVFERYESKVRQLNPPS